VKRLKLTVAYDGTPFSGWQSQANRNGVQDHLETAVRTIDEKSGRLHGAGRTDAGVHALAQCAHVDITKDLTPEQWTRALNSILPPTIRIVRTMRASPGFHARFSATGKIYRYRIWSGIVLPPFEYGRAWHVGRALDVARMRENAKVLVGKHDFARFAANRGQRGGNTVRTMHDLRVASSGSLVTLEFDADGFLYKMARLITGALVDCGLEQSPPKSVGDELPGPRGRRRLAAPACGLFLAGVRY
jgi:tRNA pseudouridine38-40 synthase